MKYNVNIAVVSRAKAGNRVTDNKPTAEAALTTGSTGRTLTGTSKSSSNLRWQRDGARHRVARLQSCQYRIGFR